MPLRLSVGVSRKLGQPGYGSIGAVCAVELELDPGLLRDDPEEFDRRAHSAHAACTRAVDAELARLAATAAPTIIRDDRAGTGPIPGTPARPATPRQLRALGVIARARGVDPDELLAGHGLDAGTISATDASRLISGLRAAAAG